MSSASTIPDPSWSLAAGTASQAFASGDVRLDLGAPAAGLKVHHTDGRVDHLLGVDLSSLADHWSRGTDVAAVYEPTDGRRLRSTVMWRSHPQRGGLAAWEVIASAQTAQLQTDVTVGVHSEFDADEILWASSHRPVTWRPLPPGHAWPDDGTALLARRGGSSCLVAVHPADARRVVVQRAAGRCVVDCRLFASALEKGVLLRSRVLAAVGPACGDDDWAGRLLQTFVSSPPPLDS